MDTSAIIEKYDSDTHDIDCAIGKMDRHIERLACKVEELQGRGKARPQPQAVPEGWVVVSKKTCFAVHKGSEVVACLSGPDAEKNAAILIGLLSIN